MRGCSYYGVNSIVMQKHCGFTEQQIDDIAKAYRHSGILQRYNKLWT